jgi:hypothetical protein
MHYLISKNKALMHRIYEEMWNKNNLAIAREIFAQPEGVERFVSQFLSCFPDLQTILYAYSLSFPWVGLFFFLRAIQL